MKKLYATRISLAALVLLGCSGQVLAMRTTLATIGIFGAGGVAGTVFTKLLSSEKPFSEVTVRKALKLNNKENIPTDWLQQIENFGAQKMKKEYEERISDAMVLQKLPVNWDKLLKNKLEDFETTKMEVKKFTGTEKLEAKKLYYTLTSRVTNGCRALMDKIIKFFEPKKDYRIVVGEYRSSSELDIVKYIEKQLENNYEKKQ